MENQAVSHCEASHVCFDPQLSTSVSSRCHLPRLKRSHPGSVLQMWLEPQMIQSFCSRCGVCLKPQYLWVSFSLVPDSCCTSLHLLECFSSSVDWFFCCCCFFIDCLKACDLITFLFLLCGHEQNGWVVAISAVSLQKQDIEYIV